MRSRRASCSCGQLSVACDGEPIRVSGCHCLACQARTGSAFGAQARWPSERVKLAGKATEWTRVGDDGGKVTFRFCPTCGATVCYAIDTDPDVIAVPVGAFADPTFPRPVYSVYEQRKHGWFDLREPIEHID